MSRVDCSSSSTDLFWFNLVFVFLGFVVAVLVDSIKFFNHMRYAQLAISLSRQSECCKSQMIAMIRYQ